jgi:hypothetical protein
MSQQEFTKITEIAEELDWNTSLSEDGRTVTIVRYSRAGQEFSIEIIPECEADTLDAESFIENLDTYHSNFDVSEAAYAWLDDTGHGKNGAPYEMDNVYKNMENCHTALGELLGVLKEEFFA